MRVQQGLPAEPELSGQGASAIDSTTGGVNSSSTEANKKVPVPVVPEGVKQAVVRFKPYFDPGFFPKVSGLFIICARRCQICFTNANALFTAAFADVMHNA